MPPIQNICSNKRSRLLILRLHLVDVSLNGGESFRADTPQPDRSFNENNLLVTDQNRERAALSTNSRFPSLFCGFYFKRDFGETPKFLFHLICPVTVFCVICPFPLSSSIFTPVDRVENWLLNSLRF